MAVVILLRVLVLVQLLLTTHELHVNGVQDVRSLGV